MWARPLKWFAGITIVGSGLYAFSSTIATPERTISFMMERLVKAESSEAKAGIISALAMAASNDVVKLALLRSGGLQVVRDLLSDSDIDVRRRSIQLLADVCQNSSISAEIIQVDGLVKQVLNCIIDNDKEISINSLMTITFLMNGTKDAKSCVFSNGGLDTLLRAVRASDMDVAHFSCCCIGALIKNFPEPQLLLSLKKDVRERVVAAICQVAQSHVQMGQRYPAIDAFETALTLDSMNPNVHNALGQLYSMDGRFVQANQHFRDVIKVAPSLIEASYNLAINLSRPDSSHKDRLAAVQTLYKVLPYVDKRHPNRHDVYFLLSRTLDGLDRTPEACHVIEQLINLSPRLGRAHRELGKLRLKLDNLSGAESALESAAQLQPHDSDTHYSTALCNYRRGDYQKALKAAVLAVQLNPELSNGHLLCGKLFAASNDWSSALASFSEVARLEPNRADGHYQMGRCLENLNRIEEANMKFADTLNAWSRRCQSRGCRRFFALNPAEKRVLDSIGERCAQASISGFPNASTAMCESHQKLINTP